MRLRAPLPVAFLLVGLQLGTGAAAQPAVDVSRSRALESRPIEQALARVAPSLVRIHVVIVQHAEGREVKREAAGSGTIITPDGHVLTNHHVAGRTRRIVCTLSTSEEVDAELVGTDPLTDVTVLKLLPRQPRRFPAAQFGDSDRLRVGDRVLALGSPFALSQSVTAGIVSNTQMVLPDLFWPFNRLMLDGEDVGTLVRWIAHDAPIYGGNSGGPLVDLAGEIVGVNEISLGLAGAIPGNLAREVAEAIIRDGRVIRSWIGVEPQPLLRSSESREGVLVGGVLEDSPAARAAIRPGDVLLRLDDRAVTVRLREELPEFNQFVARLPRDRPVTAVVLRNGEHRTVSIRASERQRVDALTHEVPEWGLAASNLTDWSARELHRPSREGVRVRGIRPGGAAADARPPLAVNDVILAVENVPVPHLEALTRETERVLGDNRRAAVLVAFERRGERHLTVMELRPRGLEDPGKEARKASLPIAVQAVSRELAQKLELEGRSGVRVTRIHRRSASEGELQVGDIIIAVDGRAVEARQATDTEVFWTILRQYPIGTPVELIVLREAHEHRVTVTLEAAEQQPREMRRYRDDLFEFRVRDLAAADRRHAGMEEGADGVLVDAVSEGGWAALARLAEGDVVLSVEGQPVADVEAMQRVMSGVADRQPRAVVLHVRRGFRTMFLEMEGRWRP